VGTGRQVEGRVGGVGDMSVGVGNVLVRVGMYWWGRERAGAGLPVSKTLKNKKMQRVYLVHPPLVLFCPPLPFRRVVVDVAVVVGLWWCDGVKNKCLKRKSAFVDVGNGHMISPSEPNKMQNFVDDPLMQILLTNIVGNVIYYYFQ